MAGDGRSQRDRLVGPLPRIDAPVGRFIDLEGLACTIIHGPAHGQNLHGPMRDPRALNGRVLDRGPVRREARELLRESGLSDGAAFGVIVVIMGGVRGPEDLEGGLAGVQDWKARRGCGG